MNKPKGNVWKCNVCGSVVTGVNWREALKGHHVHKTPTGAECRAVNFSQVFVKDSAEAAHAPETEFLESGKQGAD